MPRNAPTPLRTRQSELPVLPQNEGMEKCGRLRSKAQKREEKRKNSPFPAKQNENEDRRTKKIGRKKTTCSFALKRVSTLMPDADTSFAPCRDCTCSALRHASRAMTQHYERQFRGRGLRATQFTILATLAQTGPLSISELAEMLGLDRTTLSRNLRLIESQGWISAVAHDDQRVRRMALTAKGRKKAVSALPAWKQAEAGAKKVLRRFGLDSRPSRPTAETK